MKDNMELVSDELEREVLCGYTTSYEDWQEVLLRWGRVLVSRLAAIIK